ncbi:hypothetical protein [Burkholderia sp. JP2-270]|uniref:hypothetical protein n=1 Tax=Burkholderia sp. JP2-270 TaxID=2217913 RepID=UPI0013A69170|nr:hypothetical protein [Burkholderia sp. JP2-270]
MMAAPVSLQRIFGLFDYFPAFCQTRLYQTHAIFQSMFTHRIRAHNGCIFYPPPHACSSSPHVFRLFILIFLENNGIAGTRKNANIRLRFNAHEFCSAVFSC